MIGNTADSWAVQGMFSPVFENESHTVSHSSFHLVSPAAATSSLGATSAPPTPAPAADVETQRLLELAGALSEGLLKSVEGGGGAGSGGTPTPSTRLGEELGTPAHSSTGYASSIIGSAISSSSYADSSNRSPAITNSGDDFPVSGSLAAPRFETHTHCHMVSAPLPSPPPVIFSYFSATAAAASALSRHSHEVSERATAAAAASALSRHSHEVSERATAAAAASALSRHSHEVSERATAAAAASALSRHSHEVSERATAAAAASALSRHSHEAYTVEMDHGERVLSFFSMPLTSCTSPPCPPILPPGVHGGEGGGGGEQSAAHTAAAAVVSHDGHEEEAHTCSTTPSPLHLHSPLLHLHSLRGEGNGGIGDWHGGRGVTGKGSGRRRGVAWEREGRGWREEVRGMEREVARDRSGMWKGVAGGEWGEYSEVGGDRHTKLIVLHQAYANEAEAYEERASLAEVAFEYAGDRLYQFEAREKDMQRRVEELQDAAAEKGAFAKLAETQDLLVKELQRTVKEREATIKGMQRTAEERERMVEALQSAAEERESKVDARDPATHVQPTLTSFPLQQEQEAEEIGAVGQQEQQAEVGARAVGGGQGSVSMEMDETDDPTQDEAQPGPFSTIRQGAGGRWGYGRSRGQQDGDCNDMGAGAAREVVRGVLSEGE
ncbi:unnamed protein product [Closterium sp. Naga37s-1]|nr:unnamed protein product [Closterium sp. Naga37s-1]